MALGLVLNRSRQVPAEDSPAFGAIAERFRRAGDLERAVSLCQEGLHRFPTHVSARVTLGWSLLDLGRYEEARAELEQALKRAPDNLAAIRGLAELHDRSEHDEVAAMHRSGGKWMAEVAASAGPAEAETHHASPITNGPIPMAPASQAAADPLAMKPAAGAIGGSDLHESLEALKAFASGAVVSPMAEPTPQAVVSEFARPSASLTESTPQPEATPTAVSDAKAAGPWQPVEIETAAAHVLHSAASAAVVVSPVVVTKASDFAMADTGFAYPATHEPAPVHAVDEIAGMDEFDAPMPAPASVAAASSIESEEFLDSDGTFGLPAVLEAELELMAASPAPAAETHVDPVAVAAAETTAPSHVVRPLVLTPVVAMPVDRPDLIADEFDPELPALDGEWSEMAADAFVLPAAIEAARATADEGPGPWPPIIPDDPVEAPVASMTSQPAAAASVRRPNVHALNKFLRRVETRRANVVAQYLAG